MTPTGAPLPERVRAAAAAVADRAALVRIDHDALRRLASGEPAVKARPRHRCRCTFY